MRAFCVLLGLSAFAATACGSSDSSPITLDGTETLTFIQSARGLGMPRCPEADGAVLDDTVVVDLAGNTATRTAALLDCSAPAPNQTPATRSQITTKALRPDQRDAIVETVTSTTAHAPGRCWIDGDAALLKVRRLGVDVSYDDDTNGSCGSVAGSVSVDAMQKLLAAGDALF